MMLSWRQAHFYLFLPLFLMIFMLCAGAQAQEKRSFEAIALSGHKGEIAVGRSTIVQRDETGKISAASIRQTRGGVLSGEIADSDLIHLGYDGASHWLVFKLLNNGQATDWIVSFGDLRDGRTGHFSSIQVFEMPLAYPGSTEAVPFYLKEIGAGLSDSQFRIDIPEKSQRLVIVNIVPSRGLPAIVAPRIYSESAYLGEIRAQARGQVFYLLSFVLFMIVGGMAAVQQRSGARLLFPVYFAVIPALYILYETYGIHETLGGFKYIATILWFAYAALSLLTLRVFCAIGKTRIVENYVLFGLMGGAALVMIVGMFSAGDSGLLQVSILYGVPASVCAVLAVMTYAQISSGAVRGYTYLTSWGAAFLGLVMHALATSGVLPPSAFWMNLIWPMLYLQILLQTIALMRQGGGQRTDRRGVSAQDLDLPQLKQAREAGDHARLLKVIEEERHVLAKLKRQENIRVEEARKAQEEADEANRAKSAFLAVVSHEIRTPMTGIMGMVRLLLDSSITKQQKDYVMTIQESGDAMLALLNDILDFEKIQRGKMDLENISFDLHRLINGVVSLMSGHAEAKKIALSAQVDESLPRFVKGDPTRLRQVLLNFMGNAIKFTQEGGVTLSVKNLQAPGAGSHAYSLYFAVSDTGIGISADAQKNLFSPFAQADSTIARKFGGSGLGLAISKGLVEAMGSTVNINSQPGEGSTFFFTLTLERGLSTGGEEDKGTSSASSAPAVAPVQGLRILIVDDNAINRKVIDNFLARDQHICTQAQSGEEALSLIGAQTFDLALMDIEMHGLRGNEVTRHIRALPDPAKARLPVIALTGNVDSEQQKSYMADGMNGLVPKPIDPGALRAAIAGVVKNVAPAPAPVSAPVPSADTAVELPMETELSLEDDGTTPAVPQSGEDSAVFNAAMLQSLKDALGKDQLQSLLDELLVKADEIIAALRDASARGDLQALHARAHELKGMAGNFGLVELSGIAADIEHEAKLGGAVRIAEHVAALPASALRAREVLIRWMKV